MKTMSIPHDCESVEVYEVNGPKGIPTVWFCTLCMCYTEGPGHDFKPLPEKATVKLEIEF